MDTEEHFEASNLFPAAPGPRTAGIPLVPLAHVMVGALAGAGVWAGLRLSAPSTALWLACALVGAAVVAAMTTWWRAGPRWAVVVAVAVTGLAGTWTFLSVAAPAAVGAVAVAALAVRAARRTRVEHR